MSETYYEIKGVDGIRSVDPRKEKYKNTKCMSCIHFDVCAHKERMIEVTKNIKDILEANADTLKGVTIFEAEFPDAFVLSPITCKFYESRMSLQIRNQIPNYDIDRGIVQDIPCPYPNGNAGTFLLRADGGKEFMSKGCLVETEVHDNSAISRKVVANSCEGGYLEN